MALTRKFSAISALLAFFAAVSGAAPAYACGLDCEVASTHGCEHPVAAHPCEPAVAAPPCHMPESPPSALKGTCCGDRMDDLWRDALAVRLVQPDAPTFEIAPVALAPARVPKSSLRIPHRTGAPPGWAGSHLYLSLKTLLI